MALQVLAHLGPEAPRRFRGWEPRATAPHRGLFRLIWFSNCFSSLGVDDLCPIHQPVSSLSQYFGGGELLWPCPLISGAGGGAEMISFMKGKKMAYNSIQCTERECW